MGNPTFKFTLVHANLGTKVISEPDGWKDAQLKIERHPEFHSLVEYFEGSFIFYGENGVDDGGADFIRQCENIYGLDAQIRILIQADIDGDGEYEQTIFDGQLDLTGLEEVNDNKIEVPIIRNDFWAKFIARKDTSVDIRSSTDLDGNSRGTIGSVTLNLTSQKVRSKFKRNTNYNDADAGLFEVASDLVGTTSYLMFGNSYFDLDEIEERFEYGTQVNTVIPTDELKYIFKATYPGTYNLNASIRFALVFSGARDATVRWYYTYGKNGDLAAPVQIGSATAVLGATSMVDGGAKTVNVDLTLIEGDEVYIYGELTLNSSATVTYFPDYDADVGAPFDPVYTALEVTADTTFTDSTAEAYLLHDAAAAITDRITARANSFYSSYLGSGLTNARSYGSDGCGWNNVLVPGLQLRGYTFTEKIFSLSFSKWWKGVDPIFNLGLGYETMGINEVIRIEPKEYFYDARSVSVYFSNVKDISREYDHSKIYNQIEIGYQKWESEGLSGLDDPQGKRTYATRIQKINNTLQLYSEFMAASIAIEITRRQSIEKSKDYRNDNNIFIISINPNDVSSDVYVPELDENFSSIANLLNSDTRYNSYLTPAYNLLRWQQVPNGCLQKYPTSTYKFVSGEGNYDMVSNTDNTCHGFNSFGSLSEKQDIGIFRNYLHLPLLYTIEIINFRWSDYVTIRENRTKAIAISQTDDNYKRFFIKELIYDVCKGKCKIIAWPYEDAPILVVT